MVNTTPLKIVAHISEVLKEMDLYNEMMEFNTLIRQIKYQKNKCFGIKGTFKPKQWSEYENMPHELLSTKN